MSTKQEDLRDDLAKVTAIKVTATVTIETYAVTDLAPLHGKSVEERIADQIADAIGYRAHSGAEFEEGDVLVVPMGDPDFAADVRVSFTEMKLPVDVGHVVDLAGQLTDSL